MFLSTVPSWQAICPREESKRRRGRASATSGDPSHPTSQYITLRSAGPGEGPIFARRFVARIATCEARLRLDIMMLTSVIHDVRTTLAIDDASPVVCGSSHAKRAVRCEDIVKENPRTGLDAGATTPPAHPFKVVTRAMGLRPGISLPGEAPMLPFFANPSITMKRSRSSRRGSRCPTRASPSRWPTIGTSFRRLAIDGRARGCTVTDAHIAELAMEYDAELYTTDRGFARFPDVRMLTPDGVP